MVLRGSERWIEQNLKIKLKKTAEMRRMALKKPEKPEAFLQAEAT